MKPHRFEQGRPMLLAGLRRRHEASSAAASVAGQWREFLSEVPTARRVSPQYYGAMCGGDTSGFEYLSGVEVDSLEDLPDRLGRMRVPAQLYAVFRHPEGESLESTWRGIMAWLAVGEYESAHLPDFERYESAPDGMSRERNIEVWVGVVERNADGRSATR